MKIWARWPYICRLYFPQVQDRTLLRNQTISENIPNIQQMSTNRRSIKINDKNDNANYAPSYHMEGFTNGSRHHLKIFDQVRKDLDCRLFYSELKRHNVSHYIISITDIFHIVLENDNTVLIKGLKKVVNVKFSRNTHLIETSIKLKSREITFQQYRKNLAKAGVFRWVTNIHEHRYYYTFDNSLLFTESIQNTTQIFPR